MEEILNVILDKLAADVPELRWIDINLGQMATENPPVDYPCALIDVTDIDYTTAGMHRQVGEARIEIELYFIVRSPSNTAAPEKMREQAFGHFGTVKKVYKALEGVSGESFGGLNRVKVRRNKTYYPRPFTLVFRCSVEDRGAVPTYRKLTEVVPGISAENK